jgi:tetratricopeptide (TPR) repeat protein
VQIHLQQNRTDLALKEVQAARRWAQDSLLINIAESWVGIRVGGEKYQQAFYVFEEMAQAPASTAPLSLVSQAVAEIHLGRYEEAEEALKQAVDKDPEDADAIANQVVVSVLSGQDPTSLIAYVPAIPPSYLLLLKPPSSPQFPQRGQSRARLSQRCRGEEQPVRPGGGKVLRKSGRVTTAFFSGVTDGNFLLFASPVHRAYTTSRG